MDKVDHVLHHLCAYGFSSLINDAARNHRISGVSICRGCPKITHLFFADDNLLFCKANSQECQNLIDILQLYKAMSGQKINADKSSVFFSNNTPDDRRCEVLKEKMLSVGGREILIKAIAQAIPTYTMSYFQIPKSLCDEIEAMMRKFWWCQRGQE